MKIGWSVTSITPDRPVLVAGQLYCRISSYVHDPITATALALEEDGEQAVLVSLDMVNTAAAMAERVRERIRNRAGIGRSGSDRVEGCTDSDRTYSGRTNCDCSESGRSDCEGLDADKISFGSIHTHNSSMFGPVGNELLVKHIGADKVRPIEMPPDLLAGKEAEDFLADRLADLIAKAWKNRKEGRVSTASDYAAVGFNRRPVFAGKNGEESVMYGDCSDETFRRFEGTVDHTADMLYTWDPDGKLTGVLVDIPCPSQVMELHNFLSADYWAYARKEIRNRFGPIPVLSVCGAAGDQNPIDLVRISKYNQKELKEWNAQAGEVFRNFDMTEECQAIGERIAEAVARGYKKAANRIFEQPVLKHKVVSMALPIRRVSREAFEEAERTLAQARRDFSAEHPMTSADQVRLYGPVGIAERYEVQNRSGVFEFKMHLIRIGDAVLITNPFELFVEYGMRVRARCRANQVFHIQLSNGVGDYLPTAAAVKGGSYSSEPASTLVGPEGGEELTERMIREADELFGGHQN